MNKHIYTSPALYILDMQAQDVVTASNQIDAENYGIFDNGQDDKLWY